MKLGAVDYHFKGQDDTERFMQARQLGLDGVEVMVWNDELLAPDCRRLDQIKAAKALSGLQVCSLLMAGYNTELGIAWPDPEIAARASEGVRRAVDWAAAVGAGVVLVPFFVDTEIRNDDDFYRVGNAFRRLCPYAASHSVILGFESTLGAEDVLRMIDFVGEEGFGCYFDIGNTVFQGQDAVVEIGKLGRQIKQVHVKDTRVFPGDSRLGEGLVDFPGSAQALREIGYDGWLVGEYTEFPNARGVPAPPQEVVARDISFTRRIFPELRSTLP